MLESTYKAVIYPDTVRTESGPAGPAGPFKFKLHCHFKLQASNLKQLPPHSLARSPPQDSAFMAIVGYAQNFRRASVRTVLFLSSIQFTFTFAPLGLNTWM